MAKLTKATRSKIPTKDFAGPNRSYPIEDKVHAEKAIQLSARAVNAGTLSAATREAIVAKARKKLKSPK